ncbi:TPA: Alw26I/Eco31I/Esp3I family type II restriction adenine-specific DNA-methyltransferase [Streptococcus suis]
MDIKNFYLELFSTPYYQFIDELSETEHEKKKLLGSFYTDYRVATELIKRMIDVAPIDLLNSSKLSIIDPFSGDGRLIQIFLIELNSISKLKGREINITLWDVDDEALSKSEHIINKVKSELGFKGNLSIENTDSFVNYIDHIGLFDFCITNPPWGLLKPLKIINSRSSDDVVNSYKNALSAYDDYFKKEFVTSQPKSKFGRWGTNLGRAGVEVATCLVRTGGICGFVSPSSLFNDQVSFNFRKVLFEKYKIESISYFPAKLKLYGSADVSSVTVVLTSGNTEQISINLYNVKFEKESTCLESSDLIRIKDNEYRIGLENGVELLKFDHHFDDFKTLNEVCEQNGLVFTRELDETRISEKLIDFSKYMFAKGFMVDRYSFENANLYLDTNKIKIPKSVNYSKLVWRDVSRSTQSRRVKATLLEPNFIAGNSLGVIYSTNNDLNKLKLLLAIFNSIIFEFQTRNKLVSNHVPVGVIKTIKVPDLVENQDITVLVEKRMRGIEVDFELEVLVAKMYGLKKDDFISIAKSFNFNKDDITILSKTWEKYLK